jgi:hypothetical protein
MPLLKRRSRLTSKKPMNKVSSRHAKELKQYSQARKEHFALNPYCAICGLDATDIHHMAKRGVNLCNKDTFLSTCRKCHAFLHENVAWATEKGYIIRDYT